LRPRCGFESLTSRDSDSCKLPPRLHVLRSDPIDHLNRLLTRSLISGILPRQLQRLHRRRRAHDRVGDRRLGDVRHVHHLMLLLSDDLSAAADGGCRSQRAFMKLPRLSHSTAKRGCRLLSRRPLPPVGKIRLSTGKQVSDLADMLRQVAKSPGHGLHRTHLRRRRQRPQLVHSEPAVPELGFSHDAAETAPGPESAPARIAATAIASSAAEYVSRVRSAYAVIAAIIP
jgi:hypothetical protein